MCFHELVCATTPSPALWQEEVKAQKSSQCRVHFSILVGNELAIYPVGSGRVKA